ncbi:hypothetical protein NDU88_011527 [Pleurodeles waltl]|uniref:Uncharacterized protein n=1 Tax=Pleurodeles waltl TaxID=8319 RepID=A0AAV7QXI4_PLEWA|nr:hypothetical protein NDU88_011527 [Pleurodeles waltl]
MRIYQGVDDRSRSDPAADDADRMNPFFVDSNGSEPDARDVAVSDPESSKPDQRDSTGGYTVANDSAASDSTASGTTASELGPGDFTSSDPAASGPSGSDRASSGLDSTARGNAASDSVVNYPTAKDAMGTDQLLRDPTTNLLAVTDSHARSTGSGESTVVDSAASEPRSDHLPESETVPESSTENAALRHDDSSDNTTTNGPYASVPQVSVFGARERGLEDFVASELRSGESALKDPTPVSITVSDEWSMEITQISFSATVHATNNDMPGVSITNYPPARDPEPRNSSTSDPRSHDSMPTDWISDNSMRSGPRSDDSMPSDPIDSIQSDPGSDGSMPNDLGSGDPITHKLGPGDSAKSNLGTHNLTDRFFIEGDPGISPPGSGEPTSSDIRTVDPALTDAVVSDPELGNSPSCGPVPYDFGSGDIPTEYITAADLATRDPTDSTGRESSARHPGSVSTLAPNTSTSDSTASDPSSEDSSTGQPTSNYPLKMMPYAQGLTFMEEDWDVIVFMVSTVKLNASFHKVGTKVAIGRSDNPCKTILVIARLFCPNSSSDTTGISEETAPEISDCHSAHIVAIV